MSETQPETPAPPAPDAPEASAAPAAAEPVPQQQPEGLAARMEALEARAAAAEQRAEDLAAELRAKAAEIEDLVVTKLPGHFLHLANGDVVESEGAIPTHVDLGDEDSPKVVPVVHAFDR